MTRTIEPPRIYPTFRYQDALSVLDWFTDILGFEVREKHIEDGRLGHAELAFGSSMIMMGEAAEDFFGGIVGQPGHEGGKATYVAIDDIDALFARVEASGVAIEQGLTERPYGSREFICRDPGGNVWCFGTYWPKA
ncbi:glyoxalase [Chelativorans sp. ZYF759]|uniref:VOC family protein n=1 Tax=Chelativorans sp. ZYF759 TaxID=2692213 RepID=UPI00145ECE32|nr:VOC family protein [Chelativorans sp. ZYF759]NMG38787.1 glyoxalase [Chelativorans sp. ZYF759]